VEWIYLAQDRSQWQHLVSKSSSSMNDSEFDQQPYKNTHYHNLKDQIHIMAGVKTLHLIQHNEV
jgi:hypothetical protein